MSRREYELKIVFNETNYEKVIIDPHYEEKHSDSVSDEVILKLVKMLNDLILLPEDSKDGFDYFVKSDLVYREKTYRLIWLTQKKQILIGIVNAYRRK